MIFLAPYPSNAMKSNNPKVANNAIIAVLAPVVRSKAKEITNKRIAGILIRLSHNRLNPIIDTTAAILPIPVLLT